MPCTYTGSLEGDRALDAQEYAEELEASRDEMTALACAAFQVLEKQGLLGEMTFHQRKWWRSHKAADAARQKKEG